MKLPLALTLSVLAGTTVLFAEPDWPRFAGADGSGHSAEKSLPVKWDASAVAWKTKLKGTGQSSVVNWGDRLFLTSAAPDGKTRFVHCLDRSSGKVQWEREVACAQPEQIHKMNTYATPTCATDGERVIAFFGPGGIHAFDLDGKPQWSRNLGEFPGTWGIGASPIIDGNLVLQNCDAEGPCSVVALDKKTGAPVWTAKRAEAPKGGWNTPVIIEAAGRRELLVNGEFGLNAYDPATGKDLWFCKGFAGRGEPLPAFANGQLYVVNGQPGNTYVVKPGGSGDVTATHRVRDAKVVGGRDLPSPVVVGDYLLITSLSGMLTIYDAKTSQPFFTERLGSQISASPLVANGLVYFLMEKGEVIVIRPGKTPDIVARNTFGSANDEIFRAGLSPIQGRLYTRSQDTVYCIGNGAAAGR